MMTTVLSYGEDHWSGNVFPITEHPVNQPIEVVRLLSYISYNHISLRHYFMSILHCALSNACRHVSNHFKYPLDNRNNWIKESSCYF